MAHSRAAHCALQRIYLARSIACRGQHSLAQFSGDELYAPAVSEPPAGTQAHRTNTFVKEVHDASYLALFSCAQHMERPACMARSKPPCTVSMVARAVRLCQGDCVRS